MTIDPTHKFILSKEKNFKIAAAVANAWPEVRQQVMTGFLDRLDVRLKASLKGWQSSREEIFYEDQWATLSIWKPEWAGHYGLALQCGAYGAEMVIGVYREKEKVGKRPFSVELMEAVRKVHSNAKTNPWWDARIVMKNPATDWRSADVLWQIKTDDGFLDNVAGQLLELATISEPIVNKLVRQYSKDT